MSSSQVLRRSGFGEMGRDARSKLRNDNDIKILIVGKNSQTGIGKTTLAVQLCRFIDGTDDGWSAEDKAFVDVDEYMKAHLEKNQQSCLMLDEIEAGADRRRAMSHQNVQLSQAWMTLRARNIGTVATLPSTDALDKRMLSLSDYWVLVRQRGVAQPYKVKVNDFNTNVQRVGLGPDNDQMIEFPDLPSDDPDKEYLDSIKDDMVYELVGHGKNEKMKVSEHEKKLKKEVTDAKREVRNEFIREVYNETELSTHGIADLECVDVNQPQVSTILNSE